MSDSFAAHARRARVAVAGGGIAGLVAALECAKVGSHVTLIEAGARLGGTIGSAEIAGVEVDLTAEGFPAAAAPVRALAAELSLPVVPVVGAEYVWIAGLPTGTAPLPTASLVGIPENPWDESVRAIIGWSGAWRAYVDRIRPPMTIGRERSLGRLVRSRMGETVLERLVAPLSVGTYGIHPDDVDVDAAAPGLNAALTRSGSLSAAVAELRPEAPPRLETVEGGMARLIDALRARLAEFDVDVRTGERVTSVIAEGGRWIVETAPGVPSQAAADPAGEPATDAPLDPFDAVIVATPEATARALLAPVVPGFDSHPASATPLELVTLVFDAPALDAPAPGSAAAATAVYTVPGSRRATRLLVLSRRHPALAAASGSHVVRVTFGGPGERPAIEGLDDAEAFAIAVAEASALLGIDPASVTVRGAHRTRVELPRPESAIGRAESNAAARHTVAGVAGLGVVGAWLSGPGLAQVVLDAREEADRVRRALLWGDAPAE